MASKDGSATITWEIENFNLLLKEDDPNLWSPVWIVEDAKRNVWGKLTASHNDSFILFGVYWCNVFSQLVRCEMSVISSGGVVILYRYSQPDPNFQWFRMEKSNLFGKNRQSMLPNGTMTLCCRMWGETIRTLEFRVSSVLHNLNFLWNIEKFDSPDFNGTYIEQDNILLYASLKKKDEKGAWTVLVREEPCVQSCLSFVNCVLSIKDDRGRAINQTSPFPHTNWLYAIEIFPDNTSINLQLESIVALHKGCQEQVKLHSPNEIAERTNVSEAGFGVTLHKGCQEKLKLPSPTEIAKHKDVSAVVSCALGNDLLQLYKEKALSDATLNTEGKSFAVHRSILAARSPVFRAMFEKDEMSEGRSGVVDIDDVDSETVDRMLVYLYGHSLGDLQWKEASALYYAADKYAVFPLKEKCAAILKAGLTAENACDVLVLADKHSDQELMKCVVNFILNHEEVVSSDQWEELEKSNSTLVAKIARQLFLKTKEMRV